MKGEVHGRGPRRLDADNPAVRLPLLHGVGHAADEPAAADGDHHLLHLRQLFQDFQADGALPGDDERVVEGVGEGIALLPAEALGLRRRVVIHAGDQHHLGAVAFRGLHLADGGPGGHADDGGDAQPGGGQGDALGVVPGGAGDDALLRLLRRQGSDFVEGSPELKGAGELQVLRLDVEVPAQPGGGVEGGPAGDALQRVLRVPYHVQGQH